MIAPTDLDRSTLALGVIPAGPDHQEDALPADLQEARDRLQAQVSGMTTTDPKTLMEELHELIANQPGSYILHTEQVRAFIPYCMTELRAYVEEQGESSCSNFATLLNEEEQLYLTVLYIKDKGETAKNTLDLFIWAHRALQKLPALEHLDDEQAEVLKRACLLHDLGKINMPAIVVENPIPREAQDKIYEWYLLDPDRPPIEAPVELEDDRFDALLRGEDLDPELAKELAGKRFDTRMHIPTAFLLHSSMRLLRDDRAKTDVYDHLHATLPEDKANSVYEKMIIELADQACDLKRREEILELHRISDDEVFKTTLDRHEAISLVLANHANGYSETEDLISRAGHIFSRHHDNPITQSMRDRLDILPREDIPRGDIILYQAIRIFDIVSALKQDRAYKAAMSNEVVTKILRRILENEEGFFDKRLTEEFIGEFLG